MSVKLQINSLEALERLIGGDTELEIDIRQSVVQNFTMKHLGKLANEEMIKKSSSAIINEIHRTFFDTIKGTGWNSSDRTVFKKEVLDELKQSLDIQARQTLNKVVSEAIDETKAQEKVNLALNRAVDYIVDTLTDANLDARLDRMVNAKLKERLGI